ncbi:MAG TPA: nuclear transport factor 2 family protein [Sphingobacteriaceae bacterium]
MKNTHFLVWSIFIVLTLSPFLVQAQSDDYLEISKLSQEYADAIARRDASVHERLFASDYTYTPGNGNIMDREEHMNFTKSGVAVVDSLKNMDMVVRIYGQTAVVTGLWMTTVRTRGGPPEKRNLRYILVYAKRDGRWQIVAEQRTAFRV